ncbi:glycosyltransferase [Chloroflexota bacterium]
MAESRLKIAMLSVHSCPVGNLGAKDTGGMSVYILEIARELGKKGHLLDIYTRVHDPSDPQIVELGQDARLIHLQAGEDEAIHKLALYLHLPDFACNLENFRKQQNLEYDLVFNHYWLSVWVGQYLKQWWQVPDINMFHTLGAVKNSFGIRSDEPDLRIETERELIRDCHHIIATTEKEKEDLSHYYDAAPDKIGVIPCGVNLELFHPVDKQAAKQQLGFADGKTILFVGRIDPLKGLDQLIKAMPYLQNGLRPRLVIIGGDENSQSEMERLRALSRELKAQDSVAFLGTIKHEQLPDYYNAADLCVIPSYYESFGLVALESLACGTPVVATDVGELKNIIRQGETGYVVTDNTPGLLADKIAQVLFHPGKSLKTPLAIRESVSRFDWSNIADAVIEECHLALVDYLAPVS